MREGLGKRLAHAVRKLYEPLPHFLIMNEDWPPIISPLRIGKINYSVIQYTTPQVVVKIVASLGTKSTMMSYHSLSLSVHQEGSQLLMGRPVSEEVLENGPLSLFPAS